MDASGLRQSLISAAVGRTGNDCIAIDTGRPSCDGNVVAFKPMFQFQRPRFVGVG
jgi:hypothetical protein